MSNPLFRISTPSNGFSSDVVAGENLVLRGQGVRVSGRSNVITVGRDLSVQYSGDTGAQGPRGEPGPRGYVGEPGPREYTTSLTGPTGEKGDSPSSEGVMGPQGPQGTDGPQGPTGRTIEVLGPVGPKGLTGPRGPTGPYANQTSSFRGDTGAPGPTGARGLQGPQGIPGSQGIQGQMGDPGPQGMPGSTGLSGRDAQGPTGPTGLTGLAGPTGPTGGAAPDSSTATTYPGATGQTGATGFQNLSTVTNYSCALTGPIITGPTGNVNSFNVRLDSWTVGGNLGYYSVVTIPGNQSNGLTIRGATARGQLQVDLSPLPRLKDRRGYWSIDGQSLGAYSLTSNRLTLSDQNGLPFLTTLSAFMHDVPIVISFVL